MGHGLESDMTQKHRYEVSLRWTGNQGAGTCNYRAYERAHELTSAGKMAIAGSSDPAFRGDRSCWSPEELLVGSLSACHQLWYLHLCSEAGVVVEAYVDVATGLMEETADGSGQFVEVMLRPKVTIAPGGDRLMAIALHEAAHAKCFIARSVNFPVHCTPAIDG